MLTRPYGQLPSGETVDVITLVNRAGASVEILTYGGTIVSLRVPDRDGRYGEVVLGYASLAEYRAARAYFGAITGRIAGRVTGGVISVEGAEHALARNEGDNHLHGGGVGLDKRLWRAEPVRRPDGADSVRLTYVSPDGEEGYPGRVDLAVTYTLTADHALWVDSEAVAQRVTPISLTHHSYFNLAGGGSILGHDLQIHADAWVPAVDATMTLTDRREVIHPGAANDFRRPRRLAEAVPGLFRAHGDLYLLRTPFASPPTEPTLAARVVEPLSGRVLEVFTDESCLQFYSGAALDGSTRGADGRPHVAHGGFCLECQGYPNAAHQPAFGDILVRPGRPRRRHTRYVFSTQ